MAGKAVCPENRKSDQLTCFSSLAFARSVSAVDRLGKAAGQENSTSLGSSAAHSRRGTSNSTQTQPATKRQVRNQMPQRHRRNDERPEVSGFDETDSTVGTLRNEVSGGRARCQLTVLWPDDNERHRRGEL